MRFRCKKWRVCFGTVLLMVLSGAGGCTGDGSDENGSGRSRTLTVGLSTAPKTLDPRLATDVASARVQQLVYNSLVRKTRTSDIVPDLAESWEMTDDRTYVFRLRKNVRFHDGSECDASDIKANFEAIMTESLASPKKAAYEKLKSISIVDSYTIVFETTEPFAPFLINMVLGILPEEQARNVDPEKPVQPIGTGPFRWIERDGDDRFVLESYADYFEGKPPMDRVVFRVIPDDSIRLMELEKGSIDFMQNNIPPDAVQALRDNPAIEVRSAPGTSYFYLGFNFRLSHHPTRDVRVRQALAHALNRDEIITHVLGGMASKTETLLPADHWAVHHALPVIRWDLEEAGRLLDEAGYPINDAGIRFPIEFKVSQNNQSRRLAEIIQAQWAAIQVQVTIRSLEWGTFSEDIIDGNFESYVLSWVGVTDPDIYHSLFHSSAVPPNGRNRGRFSDADVDRLLNSARVTMDQTQRSQIYQDLQGILHEKLPYISLWHTHNVAAMKAGLDHFELYPAGELDSFAVIEWRTTPQ
ncbi:ABC transporter substrate-binding protein [bacterium]|nr:ABC transporter substrate-binding protein [candidate division CSSED10-310 bacterium]